ncbi:MAG: sulfite exporter TauE/SafE family protein [Ignavibacteriales bacterium]|nr:sulfite exporter TauE/SafE family protein [Ignavibacteriales bacterium]
MHEISHVIILFAVGVLSAFLNVMAGGGSAIALPVLIFLGLDSAVANGTNRVAILIQNVSAVASFRRQEVHAIRQSLRFTLWAMPGAVAGAVLGVTISDVWFQRILGAVMILTVVTILIPEKGAAPASDESKHRRERWIYPIMTGIGLYGGFIQVSVGFLFMAALYHVMKMDLVYVNMHKVTIVMLYMIPALAVYALTGNVDWILGLALGAGSAVGGWWAAHASVKGGEKTIRIVLVVAILVMALKLFGAL